MWRDTQEMIDSTLARDLQEAGLRWEPAAGDRFRIAADALSDEIFTLSEMTIEAQAFPTGTVLGFNGTTEWALDSVPQEDALWLPREDQLRDLLGGTFVSLTRVASGFEVRARVTAEHESVFAAGDPADAYALAVLELIRHAVE